MKLVAFRIDPVVYNKIKKIAKRQKEGVGAFIRRSVTERVNRIEVLDTWRKNKA
jgi:hypothetical protein